MFEHSHHIYIKTSKWYQNQEGLRKKGPNLTDCNLNLIHSPAGKQRPVEL